MTKIFDKIAHHYDDWYNQEICRLIQQIERQKVIKLLQPQKGQKLLDIGCGTGQYSIELARMGLDVTGIDISAHMLAFAQKKAEDLKLSIKLIEADVENIEYEQGRYDCIVSVNALEYFNNPQKILKNAYTSLKRGGRMVFGIIAGNSQWSNYYKEIARIDSSSIYNYANFYTGEELKNMLKRGECYIEQGLYFSPTIGDLDVIKARAIEDALSVKGNVNPGFVCCLWRKK